MNEEFESAKQYFIGMEETISKLPQDVKEEIFKLAGVACAKSYVLGEMKKKFDECGHDLDRFYSTPDTEYLFNRVIEPGHIYEMGFQSCLCPLYQTHFLKDPCHCECSRQSIIFILNELIPEKKFTVEMKETVLSGAEKCHFIITVE